MSRSLARIAGLLRHESARFARNPPAFMLLGVLTLMAVVLAVAPQDESKESSPELGSFSSSLTGWIVYWQRDSFVEYLLQQKPEGLNLRIVDVRAIADESGEPVYPPGVCAIELRPLARFEPDGLPGPWYQYRHPGSDPRVIWPFARWLFTQLFNMGLGDGRLHQTWAPIPASGAAGKADEQGLWWQRPAMATLLVFAVMFFAACALLVSHTSQDRESGVLRALALTPSHPLEILTAKLVFHVFLSLLFSGLIAWILVPESLGEGSLWASLSLCAVAFAGVGLCVVSVVRTQATASMLSFLYVMLIGATTFLAAQFPTLAFLRKATFEAHALGLLFHSLSGSDSGSGWLAGSGLSVGTDPLVLSGLAAGWLVLAGALFTRRAWRR